MVIAAKAGGPKLTVVQLVDLGLDFLQADKIRALPAQPGLYALARRIPESGGEYTFQFGEALRKALGNKLGIGRYGFVVPMDESEARIAIDLSGRGRIVFNAAFPREAVGAFATEMVEHFFRTLADSLGAAIHVEVRGENTHHMIEACFKGFGRALRQAIVREGSEMPSTKGTLA